MCPTVPTKQKRTAGTVGQHDLDALNESNLHQNKFKHLLKCLSQAYLAQPSFLFYNMA